MFSYIKPETQVEECKNNIGQEGRGNDVGLNYKHVLTQATHVVHVSDTKGSSRLQMATQSEGNVKRGSRDSQSTCELREEGTMDL